MAGRLSSNVGRRLDSPVGMRYCVSKVERSLKAPFLIARLITSNMSRALANASGMRCAAR